MLLSISEVLASRHHHGNFISPVWQSLVTILLVISHIYCYFHSIVFLLILQSREGRDPRLTLHGYRESYMTSVLAQGLYAISLSYSLSILAGRSRLMLAQIAFVLLERACCWSYKRFFLYIAVDHGDMSWSHRPIFYNLMDLVDSVDHSMGHHST